MAKKNLTKKDVMNGAKKAKGTPNKLNIKDKKLKKKPKALAYCRISTRTNKEKAGMKRQFSACMAFAEGRGYNLVDNIDGVISESLPTDGREVFNSLLRRAQDENIGHILIENSRALARDADVLSELHKKAKAAGITIIGGDTPDVSDNPVAKFHRHVMWAYTELEKELAVHRMQHGLEERRKGMTKQLKGFDKGDKSNKALQDKAQLTTQDGNVKYNGCTSILQSCMPE